MLRDALVAIRKGYNTNLKKFLMIWGGVFVVSAAAGFILDSLAPFHGWWNAVRTIALIPLASSMFVLGYALAVNRHRAKVRSDPDWVPFRMRFSQRWRRNISAIIAAVVFVLVYGTGFSVMYTFMSSGFVAIVFSLFVFMRSTREERAREKLGVPDVRDLQYENYRKRLSDSRAESRRAKKEDAELGDEFGGEVPNKA